MDKKDLKNAYKEREKIGGIYQITDEISGKFWLDFAQDVMKVENRFSFMKKTNQPFSLLMSEDWKKDGKDAFSFKVIEKLIKKPEQTDREFKEELITLLEMKKEEL